MKKIFLILLSGLFLFISEALGATTSDNTDTALLGSQNQLKYTEDGGLYTGIVNKDFDGGKITLPYVDGVIQGTIIIEYNTGNKTEAVVNNGELDGPFKSYYPDGSLSGETFYKDGKCVSPERLYYEDGRLESEMDCIDGDFNGHMRVYSKTGRLESDTEVKSKIPHGLSRQYNEEGLLLSEVRYVDGLRQGRGRVYYPSGAILSEFTFVDNEENGPVTEYYENGQILKQYSLYKDEIQGPVKEYYPSGRLYATSTFKDGHSQNAHFYYDETSPYIIYSIVGISSFLLAFMLTYLILRRR